MDLDANLAALLVGFPVTVTLPVQWGEQDPFGHVNNTAYFRWLESGRIAYTTKLGLADLHRSQQIGPILASITCEYRRQITFPDTVIVGTRAARIGRSSFVLEHVIVSKALGAVAAEARATLVVFDYRAGRSHPVPDAVRRAIEDLEGRQFESRAQ
jgi:acyl-CoA thioester hydrolase